MDPETREHWIISQHSFREKYCYECDCILKPFTVYKVYEYNQEYVMCLNCYNKK